jgi:hypothetical protein
LSFCGVKSHEVNVDRNVDLDFAGDRDRRERVACRAPRRSLTAILYLKATSPSIVWVGTLGLIARVVVGSNPADRDAQVTPA